MRIKDLPKVDRPQEKLFFYGTDKLSNTELLSIILGSGTRGMNVLELSKMICKRYEKNGFAAISMKDLKQFKGIGKTKGARLIAAFELGRRIFQHKKSSIIMSPKDVWNELSDIRSHKKEHFVVFYLDVRNQLIRKEIVSMGILNSSIVHPREVFEPAVKYLAAQILISHNHPSGDCSPSEEDIILTKRLVQAGEILGIEIIDHVVVAADTFYSFKEHRII